MFFSEIACLHQGKLSWLPCGWNFWWLEFLKYVLMCSHFISRDSCSFMNSCLCSLRKVNTQIFVFLIFSPCCLGNALDIYVGITFGESQNQLSKGSQETWRTTEGTWYWIKSDWCWCGDYGSSQQESTGLGMVDDRIFFFSFIEV